MAIEIYKIETSMGKVNCWGNKNPLPFLTQDELNELDVIGYTGKNSAGRRMGRQEYLNSLAKGEFDVRQSKYDNGDFSEAFVVTRVI